MMYLVVYITTLLFVLFLGKNTAADVLEKRELEIGVTTGLTISNLKGALLFKNGKPTTCELALTGVYTGFIAANCFDFVSGRQIDESVIYSVHLDDGASDQPMFSVDIAAPDVHIHPDYDPSTFANNIAVVIFYDMPNDPYTSYIVNDSFDSSDLLYVSRVYDEAADWWGKPRLFVEKSDNSECSAGSGLYKANADWMTCISDTVASVKDTNCQVPYGVMYRVKGLKTALAAIYSHSVVYGADMCQDGVKTLNYYTRLAPYLGFASKVLNRAIDTVTSKGVARLTDKTIKSMKKPANIDLSGLLQTGGNLNGNAAVLQTSILQPPIQSSSLSTTLSASSTKVSVNKNTTVSLFSETDMLQTAKSTKSTASKSKSSNVGAALLDDKSEIQTDADRGRTDTEVGEDTNVDQYANKVADTDADADTIGPKNISRKMVVVIGVVVPLAVIVLGVGLALVYRWYNTSKESYDLGDNIISSDQRRKHFNVSALYEPQTPLEYKGRYVV